MNDTGFAPRCRAHSWGFGQKRRACGFCAGTIAAPTARPGRPNVARRGVAPENDNEISQWHRGVKPVSVSVTPPFVSGRPEPLFCRVWCADRPHPRRLTPQKDDRPDALRRSMIVAEITKPQ